MLFFLDKLTIIVWEVLSSMARGIIVESECLIV
jgi:hypothetical protein